MGRRKFEDGDLCKLDRSKAAQHLCEDFDQDVIFRVAGYYRANYSRTNKYKVHPVGKEDQVTKIRPSYLQQYDGTVHGEGLQAELEVVEDRIESLQGKKQEAVREKQRIQEKIEFKNRWGLDEFDEDLWHATKIYDVIHGDDRSREDKIVSIADILKLC